MTEAEISRDVRNCLDTWSISGVVLWHMRINSGSVRSIHSGRWLKLAEKGTPDHIAIVLSRYKKILVVFIEVKTDKGRLTNEQALFADKYNKYDDFYVLKITDRKQLDVFLSEHGIDTLDEWKI